ncbi:MAG: YihY/virulence factor BrkB family protein [Chloroflexota bacterium]|nr:YihY/virulence factor BrkB family protein [Chloroflexota bacterium]
MSMMARNLTIRIKKLYRRANVLTVSIIGILYDAIQHFNDAHVAEATASIAYYAIFSLFPLLLAIIVAGSFVLESDQVQGLVLDFAAEFFPISQQFIERNIRRVLELRGTVGLVALISLVWSATGALTALVRNINRAWSEAEPRNFLESRLMALGMVSGLTILLIFSAISITVLDVLAHFSVPVGGGIAVGETPLWTTLLGIVPRLFTFFALLSLYRWVPNTQVRGSEAFWGALAATLAWRVATNGFAWFISSGIVRYELVYGSLGAIVALMLWIYIMGLIVLFGAHLAAAIARGSRSGQQADRMSASN